MQSLQQHREGREGSPDHERPGPSEAEHQREPEIADEVLDLPTEPRAGLPFGWAQGDDHEQDHGGHAAKFQENTHPSPKSDIWQKPNPRYHVIAALQNRAGWNVSPAKV